MLPAVLLAGDDQPVRGGPVQSAASGAVGHRWKGLVGLVAAAPNFASGAGTCVGYPNRPRMRAIRLEKEPLRSVTLLGRTANEGDTLAIGRPLRRGIAVHGRRDIANRLRARRIEGDERVIAAVGDERKALAVWRPLRIRVRSPHDQVNWLGILGEGHDPDLAVLVIGQPSARR